MTNKELTEIRESKKLSKTEFAGLLGISAMLLGKYEKGSCAIPEEIEKKLKEIADTAAATEIEAKKTVRSAGRKAKEASKAIAKEAEDKSLAIEIDAKKKSRAAGRKIKEEAEKVKKAADKAIKAANKANIIIQSPMGGTITMEEIRSKLPKGTTEVYVRVDENKLYYVLKNGETGDVDIWE